MTQARPLFPPTRVVPLGGGAKLIFCSGVTARGSAAAGKPVQDQARGFLRVLGYRLRHASRSPFDGSLGPEEADERRAEHVSDHGQRDRAAPEA